MKQYQFHPKVILRTPLLARQSSFSEEALHHLFAKPLIQEAIFLSSPNLHYKLQRWFNGNIEDQAEIDQLLLALTKYLLRMSNRCTPFGLFAGCSVLDWAEGSSIRLAAPKKIMRKTRLDMKFIGEWIQNLEQEKTLKDQLIYFPNQTIYAFQDKYRYIEFFLENGRKFHQISVIGKNEYVSKVLLAAQGGTRLVVLIDLLCKEEVDEEDAKNFLYQMIDAQLLLSELQANVTGIAPFFRISDILHQKSGQKVKLHLSTLQKIKSGLEKIDQRGSNNRQDYEDLQREIENIQVNAQEGKLFQTDYYRPLEEGQLSQSIKKDLLKSCEILYALNPPYNLSNLKKFKEAFLDRYEEQEVPLVEVLDTESGIGFPIQTTKIHTALVDDLSFPGGKEETKILFDDWQNFLFQLAINAIQKNSQEIDLKNHQTELEKLKLAKRKPMCPSLGIFFSVLGKEKEREKILIKSISGPSNTKLVARFANDFPAINAVVKELAEREKKWYNQKGEILAEVLHLPEARVGNVLFRPQIRDYEIPYLAKSTLPKEQQIEINDLMISIQNGAIYLRSKRLNKKVNPVISCAHAYWQQALPLYHFLGEIQLENQIADLSFQWGSIGKKLPFLPRVKYNNIYFSPAQWNLNKDNLDTWPPKKIAEIEAWSKALQLPTKFYLADDDNKLLIDLRNDRSIIVFLEAIKNRDQIILEEELIDDSTFVKDQKSQAFNNELIAFINKTPEPKKEAAFIPSLSKPNVSRTFSLGSEWLYFKVYCGPQLGDQLLAELLFSFLQNPDHQAHIDKCFFIRYYDPDPHLRIRFLLKDRQQFGNITQVFQDYTSAYQANNIIRSLQMGEYTRELERYGSQTIEAVESIFHCDSLCCIEFIKMIEEGLAEEVRVLLALKSIDCLLEDLKFTLENKIKLFDFLFLAFGREFSIDATLRKEINKKYKNLHPLIFDFFGKKIESFPFLPIVEEILEERSMHQQKAIKKILDLAGKKQLEIPLMDLAGSLVHMLCNRLFIDKQRQHELLLYALLLKFYKEKFYRSK